MRKRVKLEKGNSRKVRGRGKEGGEVGVKVEGSGGGIARVVINLDSEAEEEKEEEKVAEVEVEVATVSSEKEVEAEVKVASPLLRYTSNTTTKSLAVSENSASSLASLPRGDEGPLETDDQVSSLTPEARKHYTVEIFDEWLHTVKTFESHLLSSEELDMTNTYLNLSDNARYLFVRLFLRKIKWLRAATLESYFPVLLEEDGTAPVSPLEGAIQELVEAKFLNDSQSTQPELEELLDILTLDEIRQLCNNETWAKGLKIKSKTTLILGLIRNTQTQPSIFSCPGWGTLKSTPNRRTTYTKRILDNLSKLVVPQMF